METPSRLGIIVSIAFYGIRIVLYGALVVALYVKSFMTLHRRLHPTHGARPSPLLLLALGVLAVVIMVAYLAVVAPSVMTRARLDLHSWSLGSALSMVLHWPSWLLLGGFVLLAAADTVHYLSTVGCGLLTGIALLITRPAGPEPRQWILGTFLMVACTAYAWWDQKIKQLGTDLTLALVLCAFPWLVGWWPDAALLGFLIIGLAAAVILPLSLLVQGSQSSGGGPRRPAPKSPPSMPPAPSPAKRSPAPTPSQPPSLSNPPSPAHHTPARRPRPLPGLNPPRSDESDLDERRKQLEDRRESLEERRRAIVMARQGSPDDADLPTPEGAPSHAPSRRKRPARSEGASSPRSDDSARPLGMDSRRIQEERIRRAEKVFLKSGLPEDREALERLRKEGDGASRRKR